MGKLPPAIALPIAGIANSNSLQFNSIASITIQFPSDLDHGLDDLAIDAALVMLNLGKLWMQEYSRITSAALRKRAHLIELCHYRHYLC